VSQLKTEVCLDRAAVGTFRSTLPPRVPSVAIHHTSCAGSDDSMFGCTFENGMGTRSAIILPAAAAVLLSLGGCPTVDLGDTPTDIGLCNPRGGVEYFETVIWPDFVRPTNTTNGCNRAGGCHNEAGGNGLGFMTQAPIDFRFNYRQAQLFLNCGTPAASLMLTKPLSGTEPHGGGDIFQSNDPAIQKFIDWF
jgi:hypothetical protein